MQKLFITTEMSEIMEEFDNMNSCTCKCKCGESYALIEDFQADGSQGNMFIVCDSCYESNPMDRY